MKAIDRNRIAEIRQLHAEISGHLRTTVMKAIRIGELLAEQKAELEHGEWLPWVTANMPFSERTARYYMRFYEHRELLEAKSATVADFRSAEAAISPSFSGEELTSAFDLEDFRGRLEKVTDVRDAFELLAEASIHLLLTASEFRAVELAKGDYRHLGNRDEVIAECKENIREWQEVQKKILVAEQET